MNISPTVATDEAQPPTASGNPWLPAVSATALMVLGAALSVGVMVGLLGLPMALMGLIATTLTSRTLVGRTEVGCRRLWVGLLGCAAGLATGLGCLAFAIAAADGLLAESRARLVLPDGILVHALLAHPALWLAGPVLGAAALGIGRHRSKTSSVLALSLWTLAPPLTALLVSWLEARGWIALTA